MTFSTRKFFIKNTWLAPMLFVLVALGVFAASYAFEARAQTPITVKVLVILTNFTDMPTQPVTVAQVQNLFSQVSAYFLANSNGRISMQADVVGWYTVTRSSTNCDGPSTMGGWAQYEDWGILGFNAAVVAGVDPTKYHMLHFMYNHNCGGTPGWGLYGTPGVYPGPLVTMLKDTKTNLWRPSSSVRKSWILGRFYTHVSAHEVGHNVGAGHAGIPGTDTAAGYGDISDVMGNPWYVAGYAPLEFNAPHQILVNWLDPGQVQTVTANGTYTINSHESNTGLRFLKITQPAGNTNSIYVSMRQAIGADTNMPAQYLGGANIHIAPTSNMYVTLFQTKLDDGSTYTHPESGTTIKQISHTASTATVEVTLGGCTHADPTVSISNNTPSGPPGVTQTMTVSVKNNDASVCVADIYDLTTGMPSTGWVGTFAPAKLTLAPGQTQTATLSVTPPASATAGSYAYVYRVAHNGVTKIFSSNFQVVASTCTAAAPTLTPTPLTASGAAGAKLTYTLNVKNNDSASCPATTFIPSAGVPSGWPAAVRTPTQAAIAPGASANFSIDITSLLSSAATNYSIPLRVADNVAAAIHSKESPVTYTVTTSCTRALPTVIPSPLTQAGAAGVVKTYSVSITNNDTGCAASTFRVTPQVVGMQPDAIWTTSVDPDVVLNTGASGNINVSVTPPATQPSGNTTINMQVIDGAYGPHTVVKPVQYEIPAVCTRNTPLLTLTPSPQTGNAGDSRSYTGTLTNKDTTACGQSTFTFSRTIPSGWSGDPVPLTLPLDPNSFGYVNFTVTSPLGVAQQDYLLSLRARNASVVEHDVTANATYTVGTVAPPPVSQNALHIAATRAKRGSSSTLTWWVSSGLTAGITCSVSPASQLQSGAVTSIVGGGGVTSWGSPASPITAQTVPLQAAQIFTLSCSNGASAATSKNATANLVPILQEI
jgi:uncharacterized membrane protein